MEDQRKYNQNKKKKMAIKIGGGGGVNVGGFILLGALAAATFLGSAFAIKSRRRRSNNVNNNHQIDPPPNELKLEKKNNRNQITKGITFILPDSSKNETAKMDVAQIESETMGSTQILILDEKPKLESNRGEKIILSDIPEEQENSPLFDESSISKEEFSSPVFDNPSLVKPGDVKDNESSQEIEVITNLDEAIEADNQRPILGIIEEEEKECQGDGKIIVKKCQEGVEAANVKVETQLIEERKSPTKGNQEITCLFDNPTDLEPDDVNENEELERPLSTESNELMGSDEESGASYGDQTVIEDTQKMQLNEEQESPTSGDQEVIVSDNSIPRINACEVKQQDCFMAVLDDPTAFKAENACTNEERPLSTEAEQAMARDEEFEAAYSSSGSKFVFDSPTDLEPEDVNENKELERPLSAESNQVMCRNEEFEAGLGDPIVIEDTPHLQFNEEQESPTTGNQEVICSDGLIPRINAYEVKQQDCLIAAFDGPKAFEPENASTNKERPLSSKSDQVMGRDEEFEAANRDQISIQASTQMQATEELKEEENGDVVKKCVVVLEVPYSAQTAVEDDDHEVLVNGDQEISPFEKSTLESSPLENTNVNVQEFRSTEPENVKQDDDSTEEAIEVMKEDEAIESAHADQIAVEDNPPMKLIEEQKEDNDGRYIAVEGAEAVETVVADVAADNNPQMQFSGGGGQDEDDKEEKEIADDEEESDDDDDDDEELGDIDDENTSEKAEESSEGTGDSSMESNAEAIWPAESMQEFSLKFKESKINNLNSIEKFENKRVETEEHSYNNGGEHGYKINEDAIKLTLPYKTEVTTQNDQIVNSWKLNFFIFSILVPVVLMVLLLHRPTLFEALFHQDPL
ncbi:hypothetical protein LguiA_020247 [Lonicera macranthoides]